MSTLKSYGELKLPIRGQIKWRVGEPFAMFQAESHVTLNMIGTSHLFSL